MWQIFLYSILLNVCNKNVCWGNIWKEKCFAREFLAELLHPTYCRGVELVHKSYWSIFWKVFITYYPYKKVNKIFFKLAWQMQGWAPRSFPFGMFRSFPFGLGNVPFFSVLFSSFWWLMRPKRTQRTQRSFCTDEPN